MSQSSVRRSGIPNNATDLRHIKKVNPRSMVRLTEKPVELAVQSLQFSSHTGENVLNLSVGRGPPRCRPADQTTGVPDGTPEGYKSSSGRRSPAVADRNCVVVRRGGEHREANGQSAT